MFKEQCIIVLALSCILVSFPVFYFVNVYQWANFIYPQDALLNLIKHLPLISLAAVLFYGKLIENDESKLAGKLAFVLIILLFVAIAVLILTYRLGTRFVA
jgi:hypothetical protein